MIMDIKLRKATLKDIPFLVETIIEAEKSGTHILSYTTVFGLNEDEAKKYIALMLEEEIDGCEFSVSGFLLAVLDGKVVGAVCAWKEGDEELSSATLKSNLISYTLPEESFKNLVELDPILKESRIDCVDDSIQIGLVYVSLLARGKGLVKKLIDERVKTLSNNSGKPEDVYIQVYGNNHAAIKAYNKIGFETVLTKTAKNNKVSDYLPSSIKILMKYNPNFNSKMEKSEIKEKLTHVFHSTFNNTDLVLRDDLTASDVDNWDSLTHMILISEIEKYFGIKFRLKELNKMKNVGSLIDIIISKTS